MITPEVQKGFLFAFLCVLSGGFLIIGGSIQPILVLVGAVLILFGLLVGFFATNR